MKDLEEKFGKKHPGLEDFKDPPEQFDWLPQAYFRLHRRRQHAEFGFQPITFQEMTYFAESVLHLGKPLQPLFYRCIEAVDNAVIYDQYTTAKSKADQQQATQTTPRPRNR